MSVLSMGLSCGDNDFSKNESGGISVAEEFRETGQRCGDMEAQRHSIELDVEFWPVEHPLEPQDDDRPVKCPIPTSSLINDGRVCEESLRKRAEVPAAVNKEGVVVVDGESRVGAVRKRHHTLTHGDVSSTRMPALPPLRTTQNVTIFQMLQQFDKFDY